ncbi:hypothetical protein SNEBB_006265, partial [Seison nebaliae]
SQAGDTYSNNNGYQTMVEDKLNSISKENTELKNEIENIYLKMDEMVHYQAIGRKTR